MHHRSSIVDYRTLPPQLGSALRGEVYDLRRRADSRAFPSTVGLRRLSAAGAPLAAGAAVVPLTVPPIASPLPSGTLLIPPPSNDRPPEKAGGTGARRDGRARKPARGRDGPDPPSGGAFRIGVGRAGLDHALRVDLLVATVSGMRARGPLDTRTPIGILIKRPGALEPTEDDLGWLRAWPIASDIAGCTRGPVWAVTRHGWIDVGENTVVELPRHSLRRPPPGHKPQT